MNDYDNENTKPIKVLSELNDDIQTRTEKNSDILEEDTLSREEKYKEVNGDTKEFVTEEEKAEEALAEKNINEAEALLEKEEEAKKTDDNEENSKGIKKLIKKFKALPKKKKVLIIIGGILIIVLIITLIVMLLLPKDKEDKKEEVKEEAPVIVDNFYYKDGNLHFLDSSEKEIGTYECANKDENLCYVAFNEYRDSFNTAIIKDEDDKEILQRVPIYDDNYVFINDTKDEKTKNIVMYSINDNKEIDTYKNVKAYDDNYIVYETTNGTYGLMQIDSSNISEKIKPVYNYLGMIDGKENLVALNSKGYYIVDSNGKELSSPLSSSLIVKDYSKNLIVVENSNSYNIYNYNGDLLANDCTYASVIDNYMALVDKNNKVYVRDYENNKLNEEGIALKNKEYIKTFIYDEDNKIKETKQSFYLEEKDSKLSVVVYPSDYKDPTYTSLDLNVVKTNKNYKMINYFDGKLYFYKDEAKTDLIGSYTCNNKNTIGNNGELTSCYNAKESSFEDNESYKGVNNDGKIAPMIYNKYVFVNDGNGTIVLYDLINNKTLGTYEKISTYSDLDGTFTNIDKDVIFNALNKKGKYGMVSLTQSGASAYIKFDYNKLEKFSDGYVLAQNSENKWQILYNNNGSTSIAYDGKIQDLTSDKSYFKTKSGDKYNVYDIKGLKVKNTSDFKYVNLYDKYFIGITSDNKLAVYDYEGNKKTESITVTGTSCSIGEFATATPTGSGYNINYCSNGSSYTSKVLENDISNNTSNKTDSNSNN